MIAVVIALAAAVAAVPSCGTDNLDPAAQITVDQFVAMDEDVVCAFYVLCGIVPDDATCRALVQEGPELTTVVADVAAGRVAFDGAQAQRCLDLVRSETANCNVRSPLTDAATEACRTVFSGQVVAGGDCFFYEECAPDMDCPVNVTCADQCCPGKCRARKHDVAVGQPCAPSDNCAAGAFCPVTLGIGPQPVCTAQLTTIGQSCLSSNSCAPPLECLPFGDASGGTFACWRAAKTGEACGDAAQASCLDFRDRCDADTNVCVRRAEVGAACTAASCAGDAQCDPATNICRPRGTPGDACANVEGMECLSILICDSKTNSCQQLESGQVCSAS